MTRLHRDFLGGSLSSAVSASGTGSDVLHSAAFVSVGLVSSPDVLAVSLNPDGLRGEAPEIVHVTSHALGANTVLVARGQEGTARRAWPSGTPWVHALTALDADSAASGGGGGGGGGGSGLDFGPVPPPIVTVTGDVTTAGSWWGQAAVRFYTWTPDQSGTVALPAPPADADTQERDYYVWAGTVEDVSYPGRTDSSAGWPGTILADSYVDSGGSHPASFAATAHTTYTIGVVYFGSAAYTGRSIEVADLWRALQRLGGVTPLVPPVVTTPLGISPAGLEVLIDPPYDPSAGNTITGSDGAWAIGHNTTATGASAFAEGEETSAGGAGSHAEGSTTTAAGDHSHAEGEFTSTNGSAVAGHAEGLFGYADRYAEHAQGGGASTMAGHTRVAQATRNVLRALTTDATPAVMTDPGGGYAPTGQFQAHLSGRIIATKGYGYSDVVSAMEISSWSFEATILIDNANHHSIVGQTLTALFHTSGASAWTVAFTLGTDARSGDTRPRLLFTVTGAAATTVGWVCYLDAAQLL